ncbi:MAG: YicC family protein [Clostridiales bacterium]|nr:YicC family protein [Clostridiales bacterium]
MAVSMTGYGRHQAQVGDRDITVEIKSVNHRYFDFSCRAPRLFGFLEERLKRLVQQRVARGKVEVSVTVQQLQGADLEVVVNRPLLNSYLSALRGIADEQGLRDDITISTLAGNTDLFNLLRQDEDAEEVWQAVEQVAQTALDAYLGMREDEGARLTEDILARLCTIEATLPELEAASLQSVEHYRQHLLDLLQELLCDAEPDEGRLVAEAALYADRINITEELVRLRSHLSELRKMLCAGGPAGRKMDFLLQEMNREINTIGSKSQIVGISMAVVEDKAELEKIREQVQNLE